MTIQEFMQQQRVKGKITPAIEERWNNRILQRGWQLQGRAGANSYLAAYGKSIGVAKVVGLALIAEREGHQDMANRFWEAGYTLATGTDANGVLGGGAAQQPPAPQTVFEQAFPQDLQPGKVKTMDWGKVAQPHSFYIQQSAFWGYPDNGGVRSLIFGTPEEAAYQETAGKAFPSVNRHLDEAVVLAAKIIGPFIVDGQRYYVDAKGRQHKTMPKARKNTTLHFIIHRALFFESEALTNHATEEKRIEAAVEIAAYLRAAAAETAPDDSVLVDCVQVSKLFSEKQALCDTQKGGKIWVNRDCFYVPGPAGGDIVRTE